MLIFPACAFYFGRFGEYNEFCFEMYWPRTNWTAAKIISSVNIHRSYSKHKITVSVNLNWMYYSNRKNVHTTVLNILRMYSLVSSFTTTQYILMPLWLNLSLYWCCQICITEMMHKCINFAIANTFWRKCHSDQIHDEEIASKVRKYIISKTL